MITASDLSVEMDGHPLFTKVGFAINRGDILHIRGANGAGKTTLLKVLAGLIEPATGEVDTQENTGYIGHKLALDLSLTVKENLMLLRQSSDTLQAIDKALKKVGLWPYREHMISQLSQGQKKRVSLARFFYARKSCWLLDEPLAGLDSQYQQAMTQSIVDFVKKEKGAVIMTSHFSDAQLSIANKVLDLS